MKHTVAAIVGLSYALSLCSFLHAAERTLVDYKALFENERAKIETNYQASADMALGAYGESLAIARDTFKTKGDLTGILAATDEIKRFERDKNVPKGQPRSGAAWMLQIQSVYHAAVRDAQQVRARKTIALIQGYTRALEATQRKLVRQDRLDQALTVDAEIKRVAFIAADIQSTHPDTVTVTNPHTATSSRVSGFPEDTVEFRSHKYYWLPLRHSFAVANDICNTLGGHVVSIDNRYEYEFIKDLSVKAGRCVWLDLTDEKTEGVWTNWRKLRPSFTKWQPGEPNNKGEEDAACLNWDNKGTDMVDTKVDRHLAVLCEWEPGATPDATALAELGLCEVVMKRSGGFSVQALAPGVNRLSGGFSASLSHVSHDLRGAQFLRAPWQSQPRHTITVTEAGYLYAYKITEWPDGDKSRWEAVPDAIGGAYHSSGAFRTRVTKGQVVTFKGYEAGVIAAKITLE